MSGTGRLGGRTLSAVAALLLAGCATHAPSPSLGPTGGPARSPSAPSPVEAAGSQPAVRLPDITLAVFQHNVGVVGIARWASGEQGSEPSTLWLTSDARRWHDVTPAQARVASVSGTFPIFEQASFLDAHTGWVTVFDLDTARLTVLSTGDGGRHWHVITHGGHSLNAGATTLVQLVRPSLATLETLEPAGPGMGLIMSTDAGRTWRDVYDGPPPRQPGHPATGPFETRFVFVSAHSGFAADGIPPADPIPGGGNGDLFRTVDGGRHWRNLAPPLPAPGRAACPLDGDSGISCLFALPTTYQGGAGVIAGEIVARGRDTVGFDTTGDGGRTWTLTSHLTVPVLPANPNDPLLSQASYALVGIAGPVDWWVVARGPRGLGTWTTDDAGRTWQHTTSPTAGSPDQLQVIDSRRAWLVETVTTPSAAPRVLLATRDSGATWQQVQPG